MRAQNGDYSGLFVHDLFMASILPLVLPSVLLINVGGTEGSTEEGVERGIKKGTSVGWAEGGTEKGAVGSSFKRIAIIKVGVWVSVWGGYSE